MRENLEVRHPAAFLKRSGPGRLELGADRLLIVLAEHALHVAEAARFEDLIEAAPYPPDAFAVRAGRLLEAVCADQGVPKSKEHPALDHRLRALVTRAGVPSALTDQALLVKDYRNLGGHDDAWEVEEEDVPLIRKFVESLLDFLYWGPADLARVSAAFVKRETKAHSVELPNATES